MVKVMIRKIPENFLVQYQSFLSSLSVLIFFSSADIYLFDSGITPPIHFIVLLFGIASIPLFPSFFSRNYKYVPVSVIKWCFFYLFISLVFYLLAEQDEVVHQEFRDRIFSLIFFLIMLLIFSGKKIVQNSARWAILLVVLWNIGTYIYEIFNPGAWATLTTINDATGRAAGFYVNANKAGLALLYGMLLSLEMIPKNYRLAYTIVVFLGIVTTFSRSSIIAWFFLIVVFILRRIIHLRHILYLVLPAILLFINLEFVGHYLTSEALHLGISTYDMQTRIATFTSPGSRQASDDTSRKDVIGSALREFQKKPVFGHGLAYDQKWKADVRPHNIHLTYSVQHGIVGFLIAPLLAYSITKDARGETKKLTDSFLFLFLLSSIFSHTILYNRENILIYALTAVISKKSS